MLAGWRASTLSLIQNLEYMLEIHLLKAIVQVQNQRTLRRQGTVNSRVGYIYNSIFGILDDSQVSNKVE